MLTSLVAYSATTKSPGKFTLDHEHPPRAGPWTHRLPERRHRRRQEGRRPLRQVFPQDVHLLRPLRRLDGGVVTTLLFRPRKSYGVDDGRRRFWAGDGVGGRPPGGGGGLGRRGSERLAVGRYGGAGAAE